MEQKVVEWLLPYLAHWGYAALFLLSFLETAAFFGFLLPGETTVVIAGLLASRGTLALDRVIVVVALGAIAGDNVGYFIGRIFGARMFLSDSRRFFFNRHHLEEAQGFFERHGGKTVFFGRFVAWLRAFAPLVAGLSHMPYGKFLFFNAYGGIVWASVFSLLGYLIGNSWQLIKGYFGRMGLLVFLLSALILYATFLLRRRRHVVRKHIGWIDRMLATQLPSIWEFIKGRFRGGVWYGWNLTLAGILLLLSVYALHLILQGLSQQDLIYYLDFRSQRLAGELIASGLARSLVITVNDYGPYLDFAVVGAMVMGFILRRHAWELVALFLALALGAAFFAVLQTLIAAAPPLATGFPSGDAFAAILVYGFLMHAVWRQSRGEILRMMVFTLCPVAILLIGFSQLALARSWLTDILGGYAAGIAWLAISLTLTKALEQNSEETAG